jgi:hypothetical protein
MAETKKVESKEKIEFREIIEAYKKQNPAKYELKKKALEAKLESL